ncbi:hypothetical protein GGR53DRAFT_471119 [Hypoxylon sp. FL1150]|nr:hypothetical protein GGR53DRAFT_471119 [Hypoxylon sp. FL1150]
MKLEVCSTVFSGLNIRMLAGLPPSTLERFSRAPHTTSSRALVVSIALKHIKSQNKLVIGDFDEETFEGAFDMFRPVIQGEVDADASGRLTQAEISKTVEFCFKAFAHVSLEEKEALVNKLKKLGIDGDACDDNNRRALDELEKKLTLEE